MPPRTVACGFLTLSIRSTGTQVSPLPGSVSVSDSATNREFANRLRVKDKKRKMDRYALILPYVCATHGVTRIDRFGSAYRSWPMRLAVSLHWGLAYNRPVVRFCARRWVSRHRLLSRRSLLRSSFRGQLNAAELARAKASPVVTRSLGNTETNPLPTGVLKALAGDEAEYCDQFEDGFDKGCGETFQANLMWSELRITPQGQPAILIENRNTSFCGSAGCALKLFIEQPDNRFAQILERDGEVGTLDRISVLKTTANGHYNIQKIWADGKTHTIYRWNGSRYSAD